MILYDKSTPYIQLQILIRRFNIQVDVIFIKMQSFFTDIIFSLIELFHYQLANAKETYISEINPKISMYKFVLSIKIFVKQCLNAIYLFYFIENRYKPKIIFSSWTHSMITESMMLYGIYKIPFYEFQHPKNACLALNFYYRNKIRLA